MKLLLEEELIHSASVTPEGLLITDCSYKAWLVPFNSSSVLASIPIEDRNNFQVDEDGSYIYWPNQDIHLDMESLRLIVDSKLRESLEKESIAFMDREYEAIKTLMDKFNIRSIDINEIKKGEYISIKSLRKLASLHIMSVNDYLEELSILLNRG